MSEHDLLLWLVPGFGSVMSVLAGLAVWQLRDLSRSVRSLSVDMAVVAERVNSHEQRLKHLEHRR